MADVKWIKVTTDIFDDEKILLIESLPESDSIIVIWFKLLCLAGKQNNSGVFMINDKIPYTDKMLTTIFRRKESTVKLALDTFEQLGMIEIVNDVITIPNWEKHQNIEGLEKIREQTRKRVAEHRAKQKQLANVTVTQDVTLPVTQCNATDKNRTDKNRKDNLSQYETEFKSLWNLYPKKQGKANAFKSYVKARKEGTTAEQVEQGINNYKRYIESQKIEQRFIKQGSTWFNQRCWEDDYSVKADKGKFNDFDQRTYDYSELEERLMNR